MASADSDLIMGSGAEPMVRKSGGFPL